MEKNWDATKQVITKKKNDTYIYCNLQTFVRNDELKLFNLSEISI